MTTGGFHKYSGGLQKYSGGLAQIQWGSHTTGAAPALSKNKTVGAAATQWPAHTGTPHAPLGHVVHQCVSCPTSPSQLAPDAPPPSSPSQPPMWKYLAHRSISASALSLAPDGKNAALLDLSSPTQPLAPGFFPPPPSRHHAPEALMQPPTEMCVGSMPSPVFIGTRVLRSTWGQAEDKTATSQSDRDFCGC